MKIQLKYIFSIFVAIFVFSSSVSGKSLWLKKTNNERGMFADKVAANIGDILTVVVSEKTLQNNKLDSSTQKSASIVNAVLQYIFPSTVSGFGTHNGELPGTNITGSNDFSGNGAIKNESKIEAKTSVEVVDVLPNGNLVIEGVRLISFSDEREFSILRGIVRPYDIATDNTVDSSKIADAQIEYIKEGSLTAAQRKGWLLRLNDFINPF